jgi:hypothetical protein
MCVCMALPVSPSTTIRSGSSPYLESPFQVAVDLLRPLSAHLLRPKPAGTAFTYQIAAAQNPTGYGATGLPAGLNLNTVTGAHHRHSHDRRLQPGDDHGAECQWHRFGQLNDHDQRSADRTAATGYADSDPWQCTGEPQLGGNYGATSCSVFRGTASGAERAQPDRAEFNCHDVCRLRSHERHDVLLSRQSGECGRLFPQIRRKLPRLRWPVADRAQRSIKSLLEVLLASLPSRPTGFSPMAQPRL